MARRRRGRAGGEEKARGPRYESTLRPPLAAVPGGVQLPGGGRDQVGPVVGNRGFPSVRPAGGHVPAHPTAKGPAGPARAELHDRRARAFGSANAGLRCQFSRAGGKLRLASLWNEMAAIEMARRPDDCALWLVEIEGKRYAGSRDFVCQSVAPLEGKPGFRAVLVCPAIGLEATLSAWIDDELRMGLSMTNRAAKPLDFKLAFPHLAGLALSR